MATSKVIKANIGEFMSYSQLPADGSRVAESSTDTPAGQPPPSPAVRGALQEVFKSFNYITLVPGAALGAAAFLATLFVSLTLVVLALAGVSASNSGSTALPSNPMIPADVKQSPWSMVAQLAVQLVAMGFFGAPGLTVKASIPFLGNIDGSGGVFAVPLILTAISAALLYLGARLARNRVAVDKMPHPGIFALSAGLALTILVNVSAAVFAISFPAVPSIQASPLTSVTFGSVVFAFLIGACASYAGVVSSHSREGASRGLRANTVAALEVVGVHYGIVLAVVLPALSIALGIKFGWQATLSAPLWAPTAGLFLVGLAHLSAAGRSWSMSSYGSSSTNSAGSEYGLAFGDGLSQFGIPGWTGWVLLLLALIAVLVSSTFWYLRRPAVENQWLARAALPLAFLVAGTLITWISTVSGSFQAGSLVNASGTFALAWWTPFIMLVWGIAIEASTFFVAPHLVPYVPAALVKRIVRPAPTAAGPAVFADSTNAGIGSTPTGVTSASYPAQPTTPVSHPALAPREPLSPSKRRTIKIVLIAALAMAVLVAGGAITLNVIRGANGPELPVRSYLEALTKGEAGKAMGIADPGLANDQRALLTDEVYSKTNKRIDGFDIVSSSTTEDQATVVAELRQDGRKQRTTFSLRKDNPDLLNDHWRMETAPISELSITLDTWVPAILVNGQEVKTGADSGSYSTSELKIPALPGEYIVELPASEKYLQAEKSTALVKIGDSQQRGEASLSIQPSDELEKEVNAQAEAYLAQCLKSTEASPANCPNSMYVGSYARNFTWALDAKPAFSLTKDTYSSKDSTLVWRLRTETSGKATVSYESNKSYSSSKPDWQPAKETDTISFGAIVTVTNGDLQVKFSNY
jgi:hypothetical protein